MTHTPATVDVPRERLNYQYIQWCSDAEELEQIYKVLKSGIMGSYPLLEPVTLNRIQTIHPNSEILQQGLINNRQQKDHPSTASPLPSAPDASRVSILEGLSDDAPSVEISSVAGNIYNGNEPSSIETASPKQPEKSEDDQNQLADTKIPPSDRTAEEYFRDGQSALEANNCDEAIVLFTKSLALDRTNPEVYMGRAQAYSDLNGIDAAISDYSNVLSLRADHQGALAQRAACFLSNQQIFEAQTDLIQLLALNPNHPDGAHLSSMIGALQEAEDGYSPEIGRNNHSRVYPRISNNSTRDLLEEAHDSSGPHRSHNSPENVDLSEAQELLLGTADDSSKSMDQSYLHWLADNEDDVPSGNRLKSAIQEDRSRQNVDVLGQKSLPSVEDESETSSDEVAATTLDFTDHKITSSIAAEFSGRSAMDLKFTSRKSAAELYHQASVMSSNSYSKDPYQKTSNGMETFDNLSSNSSRSSKNDTMDEAISKSNFSSTIQSWLRDAVRPQLNNRLYSYYDRPWSSALIPWSLEGINRDLNRYHRYQETSTAIDVAKILLRNGILDYHQHAEYIVNALVICAESYFELKEYPRAIRYASEALEYDKKNTKALMVRARAFEKQNLPLFSYADYTRIPDYDFEHYTAFRASEKLAIGLEESKGETWREQLPVNFHDDGFFMFLQTQEDSSADDFYQIIADQLYADACFVLAIQCYTRSIELTPDNQLLYARRAACYVKVFEHQKAIADCDRILNDTDDRFNVLYCKARALKISRDSYAYETTLEQCLKLQPSNQILLAEYHTERHEAVPRKKRRIRLQPPSPSKMLKTGSTGTTSETPFSFEELEQLRAHISDDPVYTLQAQLDLLKSDDIEGQCAFVLRLSEDNMIETFPEATEKLVDTILDGSRTMIELERNYQDEHPSLVSPFSYALFSFRVVRALRKLPKIEEMLQWILERHRTKWNELEEYFSSSPALRTEIEQILLLKEGTVE